MNAGPTLVGEALLKERREVRGERRHGRSPLPHDEALAALGDVRHLQLGHGFEIPVRIGDLFHKRPPAIIVTGSQNGRNWRARLRAASEMR